MRIKRGYRQETLDWSIRGIKFSDRQKMLANKPQSAGECLAFTTAFTNTHRLRRLLVKHWHLIEKSHCRVLLREGTTVVCPRLTSPPTHNSEGVYTRVRHLVYVVPSISRD